MSYSDVRPDSLLLGHVLNPEMTAAYTATGLTSRGVQIRSASMGQHEMRRLLYLDLGGSSSVTVK